MSLPWNDGILEYWNNVLKMYSFSVRIKVLEINFHYLFINIFIGSIWFESYLPNFYLFVFFEEIQST